MKEENSRDQLRFDPADYPALREFLPAYLHQDFREEYESAGEAVRAFASEASGDEIVQVQEEWKKFREGFAGRALEDIRAALKDAAVCPPGGAGVKDFGSAWYPQGEEELREVDKILSGAET